MSDERHPMTGNRMDPGATASGFGAGFVLTAVGAGSLVSFPILIGAGLSPLVANVCNNVGLIPGGLTGAFGFRRELAGHRHLVIRVAITSAIGALLGAALLLELPPGAFDAVVPFLVLRLQQVWEPGWYL